MQANRQQSRESQRPPELSGGHTDDLPEMARKVTLIRKPTAKAVSGSERLVPPAIPWLARPGARRGSNAG